jgi:deazaflavin-dependent oxidoreductase (nitroreductase family)
MDAKQEAIPHVPSFLHFSNPLFKLLVRLGFNFGPISMILLTVYGRKTGQPHTTPIGLFTVAGRRYVFSSFGEVNWVRNLRSNKNVTIAHGRHTEALTAIELPTETAASVLEEAIAPFLTSLPARLMAQSWYNLKPGATHADYLDTARHHPVFELIASGAS